MMKTLTKNDKYVLDTIAYIKNMYKDSDDVEEAKNFWTIRAFFDKFINSVTVQDDSKLAKIVKHDNYILTGWQALGILHNKMKTEFNNTIKCGLIDTSGITDVAKQVKKLGNMSGGGIHELKGSFYTFNLYGIQRASYKDNLKKIMDSIVKDIKK